ncbi:hypothetical protein D9756_006081 [Leucocoprinus leucothites]|uniref:F-box domain-containing protein n=1 Tax=Leucocoprinus leucothites TaxID=201217 RepID=A0A8H5D3A8_9AGAR|nr:hypothetical protein D9756_006081 [Leucoagaricus leucothites]
MPAKRSKPQPQGNKRQKTTGSESGRSSVVPVATAEVPPQASKARIIRKKGRLACFLNLPLDLWSETFGYLEPYDLLKLSRTTKDFREMLMSRSARQLWIKSLASVPLLPPCPQDMSEPAYTNLVFSPYCNLCQARTSRAVDWNLRVRMCTSCFKEEVGIAGRWEITELIFQLIPTQLLLRQAGLRYLKYQYKHIEEHLESLNQAQAKEYVKERQQMMRAHKEHARLCEIWAQSIAKDRSQELEKLKRDRFNAIASKLRELGWGVDIDVPFIADALRRHEFVKKPQKLTEKIWVNIKQPLLEFMEPLRNKRLEQARQRLIDRRKLAVIEFIRKFKNDHLLSDESKFGPPIWPEPADYLDFELIRKLVDMPGNEELTPEVLSGLKSHLDCLMGDWCKKVERKFMAHVRSCIEMNHKACHGRSTCNHQTLLAGDDDQLSYFLDSVTTIFRCQTCTSSDTYDWDNAYGPSPDDDPLFLGGDSEVDTETKIFFGRHSVLRHQCLTREILSFDMSVWTSIMGPDNIYNGEHIKRYKHSFENITLDEAYGRVMANIVKVAQQDPIGASIWDLRNRHFYCHTCFMDDLKRSPKNLNINYFKCHEMAMHIMEYHHGTAEPRQISRRFFRGLRQRGPGGAVGFGVSNKEANLKIYSCTHCRDLPKEVPPNTRDGVISHVRIMHGNKDPIFGQDFFKVPDADSHYPAPFRKNLFSKRFLVVSDREALGDGPDIDWERLLGEQFDKEEMGKDDEGGYGSKGFDYDPEPEDVESDTDNERNC